MASLHDALGGMRSLKRWFLWRLTWDAAGNKCEKKPMCGDAGLPENWMQYDDAVDALDGMARGAAALGYWMLEADGYWFLDIDGAHTGNGWSPLSQQLVAMFPGALVEASSSGRGLHLIGRCKGLVPPHRSRGAEGLEFYTNARGIAFGLTGDAHGSADTFHDEAVRALVAERFPPIERKESLGPDPRWRGPEDDDALIVKMMGARQSAEAAFGGKPSFRQLWEGVAEKNSENDMALMSHLSFWTGNDWERMVRLACRSGMVRDKWNNHRTYLADTARKAANSENVYVERGPVSVPPSLELGTASATSELANAERLRIAHGADLLHVEGIGWHLYQSGGPWKLDPAGAQRLAFALGRAIEAEAVAMDSWVQAAEAGTPERKRREDVQKNRQRWAKCSEGRTVITNSLALLSAHLSTTPETLDANPLLVGCPSGVIDLATCRVRPHAREDRITKVIAVDYEATATAPRWEAFIAEIFAGDADLIRYVQTLTGYMLSGQRGHHLLPVFYGSGANGKSTFLSTIQSLLGDYAGTAPAGLLISNGANDHPTGLASLKGRRVVIVSETGEAGRMNESQVKLLTGGDRITARMMRQDFFEFTPSHILILQTNHKPRVTGNDEGIWRRLKLVPFTVTIPPERRDAKLPEKLAAELPGILAWAVCGWQQYQRDGFREPQAVRHATAEYRVDSDHVGAFLGERCALGPEHTCTASALYLAYTLWCAEAGERPLSQRTLGLRLAERPGVEAAKGTGGVRTWRGVAVAAALRISTPGVVLPMVR
jgi:putative DNA primase/helicase